MEKRAIRVATICHSQDNHTDKKHRRVRIELHKDDDGYCWYADGEDCGIGTYATVARAERAAYAAWGQDVWAMKCNW